LPKKESGDWLVVAFAEGLRICSGGITPLRFSTPPTSGMVRSALIALVLATAALSANALPSSTGTRLACVSAHQATRRATPEEVGHQAGLKIREQLANERAAERLKKERTRHGAYPQRRTEALGYSQGPDRRARFGTAARAPSPRRASFQGYRIPIPSPLLGARESLVRQNEKSEAEGLVRIEDEDDLADRIDRKLLVPLPTSAALIASSTMPENHRFCRPWTARFLADLARVHAAAFHHPIEVTSAVRTVAYQRELMLTNGNAAPAEGDIVSPHLTGGAVDLAKQGLSRQELGWMRSWLLPLQKAGKIDVEEEFAQPCFHISVYTSYLPSAPSRKAHRQAPNSEDRSPQDPTRDSRLRTPDSLAVMGVRGR
jgi:hypothetical protein